MQLKKAKAQVLGIAPLNWTQQCQRHFTTVEGWLIGTGYSTVVQASSAHCPRNGLWTCCSYAANRHTTPQSATLSLHPVIHVPNYMDYYSSVHLLLCIFVLCHFSVFSVHIKNNKNIQCLVTWKQNQLKPGFHSNVVACVFRLRNARNASDCVWMETGRQPVIYDSLSSSTLTSSSTTNLGVGVQCFFNYLFPFGSILCTEVQQMQASSASIYDIVNPLSVWPSYLVLSV